MNALWDLTSDSALTRKTKPPSDGLPSEPNVRCATAALFKFNRQLISSVLSAQLSLESRLSATGDAMRLPILPSHYYR